MKIWLHDKNQGWSEDGPWIPTERLGRFDEARRCPLSTGFRVEYEAWIPRESFDLMPGMVLPEGAATGGMLRRLGRLPATRRSVTINGSLTMRKYETSREHHRFHLFDRTHRGGMGGRSARVDGGDF
jgi:hypothetical protein